MRGSVPSVTGRGMPCSRIIRRCAMLEPASEHHGILCQTPLGENVERHSSHRTGGLAAHEATLEQPLLVAIRVGILAHGLFQYGTLEGNPDRVRCGISLPLSTAPIGRIQRRQELTTDL